MGTTTTEKPATLSARRSAPQGTETVLLVEDDEIVRKLTRMILEDFGYRVLAAESGVHASQLNRSFEGEIHLLLSDVMMPGGNGVEWARRLRRDRPAMEVLFISGYTRETLRREGVPDPGVRFLQKPFPPEALARMIRNVLDR